MNPTVTYLDHEHRLRLDFDYDSLAIDSVKGISGRKYVPPGKGGPGWTVPASLSNARRIREIFGDTLVLHRTAVDWGKKQIEAESNLASVHGAETAELKILPDRNPELHEFIATRPYQLADVAFMGMASCVNANEPSLGKTVETIASMYESGLIDGHHLIVAPVTALVDTWATQLSRWAEDDLHIYVAHGKERDRTIEAALRQREASVVITNPDTVRRKSKELMKFNPWSTITIDEFHLSGLSSPKNSGNKRGTVFFKTILDLEAERRWALSGTPIGGKPIRLWPALHWLYPSNFTSKWQWADRWLYQEEVHIRGRNSYGRGGTVKKVMGIRDDLVDKFYQEHKHYLIRRTKAEVRPELPEKIGVDVWCDMTDTQKNQYQAMATETEIRIDEENLSANNVLALYTRLKQFATARQEIVKVIKKEDSDYPTLVLRPTDDSGKLPHLMENLAERGIDSEMEGDTAVIIGTQFRPWAERIQEYLIEQGIPADTVGLISGKVPVEERQELINGFEREGRIRVLIIVTKAGGTSLNLDRAESLHIMDETWNPDDQTQLSDRGHRFTGLTVYTYRTKGSIEEYINEVGFDKREINKMILDLRGKMSGS